jgi:hypothetical protein
MKNHVTHSAQTIRQQKPGSRETSPFSSTVSSYGTQSQIDNLACCLSSLFELIARTVPVSEQLFVPASLPV